MLTIAGTPKELCSAIMSLWPCLDALWTSRDTKQLLLCRLAACLPAGGLVEGCIAARAKLQRSRPEISGWSHKVRDRAAMNGCPCMRWGGNFPQSVGG